jgi:hypothetical protein
MTLLEAADCFSKIRNTFVYHTYFKPADETYLLARFSGLSKLGWNFFWNANHALEKYLKGILLLHGESIKNKRHSTMALWNQLTDLSNRETIHNTRLKQYITNANFSRETRSIASQQVDNFRKDFRDALSRLPNSFSEYVKLISHKGVPSSRYHESNVEFDSRMIPLLDEVVFELRNYCNLITSDQNEILGGPLLEFILSENSKFPPILVDCLTFGNSKYKLESEYNLRYQKHWATFSSGAVENVKFTAERLFNHNKIDPENAQNIISTFDEWMQKNIDDSVYKQFQLDINKLARYFKP